MIALHGMGSFILNPNVSTLYPVVQLILQFVETPAPHRGHEENPNGGEKCSLCDASTAYGNCKTDSHGFPPLICASPCGARWTSGHVIGDAGTRCCLVSNRTISHLPVDMFPTGGDASFSWRIGGPPTHVELRR